MYNTMHQDHMLSNVHAFDDEAEFLDINGAPCDSHSHLY